MQEEDNMNYWSGHMNWPIDQDWKCEICGGTNLIWGMINGVCRCDKCYTEYGMRDDENKIVTRPIWFIKPEYAKPAKWGWETYKKPISEFSDDEWDVAIETTRTQGGG